jgi:DNA-binding MarR family transcriptional regulator
MIKRNYPLVEKQIRTLKLLYKFRFGTTTLLAEFAGVTRSTMNTNLLILHRNELIERHYTSTDKLDRKAARYFLTSKGIKQLKSVIELNDGVVRSYYKNKTVSQSFVQHNLDVFRTFLNIDAHYPERFNMLTKTETAQYNQFPELRPDLFLQSKDKTGQYFL